jgi:hypothetical protein
MKGLNRRELLAYLTSIASLAGSPKRVLAQLKQRPPDPSVPFPIQDIEDNYDQDDSKGGYVLTPECPPVDPFAPLEEGGLSDFAKHKKYVKDLSATTVSLDSGFKFSETPSTDFRYHQVEQLLAQIATLIERGITSRTEWQDLGERSFARLIELKEFADLDDIHADEIKSGYYAFPLIQSLAETEALWYSNNSHEADQVLAYVNKIIPGPSSVPDYRPKDLGEASANLQAWTAKVQDGVAKNRFTAAGSKANYDNCDVTFRRRRTVAARQINALKLAAYSDPDGPLNFDERRAIASTRFKEDFGDALLRLATVKQGLELIYGYKLDLKASSSLFDDALMAVRAAMEWLVRFTAQEQNYILPISVRCISEDNWKSGLWSSKQGGTWSFDVPASLFPSQAHVRLRGISATITSKNSRALFQSMVQVPQTSVSVHLDGKNVKLDQSMVPVIRIGRVAGMDSQRSPDTVGTLALHNASPIGSWKVAASASSSPLTFGMSEPSPVRPLVYGGNSADIDDLVIHLLLAIRSV